MLFNCIPYGSSSLPTWTPDWQHAFTLRPNLRLRMKQEPVFQACGSSPRNVTRASETTLKVNGFRLDIIDKVNFDTDTTAPSSSGHSLYEWFGPSLYHMEDPDSNHRYFVTVPGLAQPITRDDVFKILTKIAINDCTPAPSGDILARLSKNNYLKLCRWLTWGDYRPVWEWNDTIIPEAETLTFEGVESPSISEFARQNLQGKVFFTTRLGLAGVMDASVATGDEIWILSGGSHPVVLDPGHEEGEYHVVSEAYVHGIMDGEATRGECPILPADGKGDTVLEDNRNGRTSWPTPKFTEILLV